MKSSRKSSISNSNKNRNLYSGFLSIMKKMCYNEGVYLINLPLLNIIKVKISIDKVQKLPFRNRFSINLRQRREPAVIWSEFGELCEGHAFDRINIKFIRIYLSL